MSRLTKKEIIRLVFIEFRKDLYPEWRVSKPMLDLLNTCKLKDLKQFLTNTESEIK